MKRIIYFCPKIKKPTGGVKVIHRHCELINALGGDSQIYYMYSDTDRMEWFDHTAPIKSDLVFDKQTDVVMLPESQIFDLWRQLSEAGIDYGIFVQNGYLIDKNIRIEDLSACYDNAKTILCISEDAIRCVMCFFPQHAAKITRVTYSIDTNLFKPGPKQKIITFMPRKMKAHSDLLVPMLRRRLPTDWQVVPIDGLPESQVAQALSASRIFLSFSDFEGLPVPPVEAALSGNFVVGYTGQGGREYWSPPVLESVEAGDIVGFIHKTLQKVDDIDRLGLAVNDNHLTLMREYFSKNMETRLIEQMIERLG